MTKKLRCRWIFGSQGQGGTKLKTCDDQMRIEREYVVNWELRYEVLLLVVAKYRNYETIWFEREEREYVECWLQPFGLK